MPTSEIPSYFHPEIRHLIAFALEDGWREMKTDGALDQRPAKKRLASKWLHSPPSLRQIR